MAEIPSDIASSAAQSGYQSREVAKERGAARAGQAHTVNRQVRAADEAGSSVDTTDADARVFADTEGQGSLGRQTEAETNVEGEDTATTETDGIIRDDDGQLHLDLEA